MKRLLLGVVGLVAVMGLGDAVLHACGSKFLVANKGARYQRVLASIEPTRILFYWPQDRYTPDEDRWNPTAEEMLEGAGHTVEVVHDNEDFLDAAGAGVFDVLVLPIAEARRLEADVAAVSRGAAVVPLLVFPSRSDYSRAREEFGAVLKLPTTADKMLAALEVGRRQSSTQ